MEEDTGISINVPIGTTVVLNHPCLKAGFRGQVIGTTADGRVICRNLAPDPHKSAFIPVCKRKPEHLRVARS